MNIDNIFDLIFAVVFAVSPQLIGLGPKTHDHVIPFFLWEGVLLTEFHLKDIQERG